MSFLKSLSSSQKRRKILRVSLYAIFATYLVFCADVYFRQERYLLEPNVNPPGYRETKFSYVPFTLSGAAINGKAATIHYRKYGTIGTPRNEAVFYLHGNKGNMNKCEFQIEFMLELGYDVWTMDYREYGDSDGKISEEALKKDAAAVYNKILAEVDAESIVIWGRSFGSGVAASVAASATDNHKPKMLVLETPYWSIVDAAWHKWVIVPPILFRYELPTHKFLMSVNCPIHLLHGTLDEKIPFNSSERLLDVCKSNGLKVKGHSIMCGQHDLRDKSTYDEFLERTAIILR